MKFINQKFLKIFLILFFNIKYKIKKLYKIANNFINHL